MSGSPRNIAVSDPDKSEFDEICRSPFVGRGQHEPTCVNEGTYAWLRIESRFLSPCIDKERGGSETARFFRKFIFLRNFGNVLFFFFCFSCSSIFDFEIMDGKRSFFFGLWIVQVSGEENFGEFLRK